MLLTVESSWMLLQLEGLEGCLRVRPRTLNPKAETLNRRSTMEAFLVRRRGSGLPGASSGFRVPDRRRGNKVEVPTYTELTEFMDSVLRLRLWCLGLRSIARLHPRL